MRIIILCLTLLSLYACSDHDARKKASNEDLQQQPKTDTSLKFDTAWLKAREQVGQDLKVGKGKYYFHSIALPAPALVTSIKKKFGVALVGMGCALTKEETSYNRAMNEFMFQWHNQSIAGYLNTSDARKPY